MDKPVIEKNGHTFFIGKNGKLCPYRYPKPKVKQIAVYKMVEISTGKVYVGSSMNIKNRFIAYRHGVMFSDKKDMRHLTFDAVKLTEKITFGPKSKCHKTVSMPYGNIAKDTGTNKSTHW